ncbi:unnamed protein product [Blepharisma stoltei]|uniref:Uncharacterized protein n=1 Tax=Blepharisma stoltei TaxID=1481888 RepID=A0AAU9K9Z3_9CILI|nr:unnamed protein product [Blepharisma stoltei]
MAQDQTAHLKNIVKIKKSHFIKDTINFEKLLFYFKKKFYKKFYLYWYNYFKDLFFNIWKKFKKYYKKKILISLVKFVKSNKRLAQTLAFIKQLVIIKLASFI